MAIFSKGDEIESLQKIQRRFCNSGRLRKAKTDLGTDMLGALEYRTSYQFLQPQNMSLEDREKQRDGH